MRSRARINRSIKREKIEEKHRMKNQKNPFRKFYFNDFCDNR